MKNAAPVKGKRKKKTKWIVLAVLAALVIALAGYARSCTAEMRTQMNSMLSSVERAQVETGSITSSVSGSGTLTVAEGEDITVPQGVEIADYYVEAGDTVSAGDLLAAADRTSVLTAIAETQTQLNTIDASLEEKKDDTEDASLTTGVSGRVKVIYAQEGDSVAEVMNEYGALMLLSLDGKMAVALEQVSGLSVGTQVNVTLSDGTVKDGEVESLTDTGVIVTLTDSGTDFGDEVTVSQEDGTPLGTGTLYIYAQVAVTGYTGTVDDVRVKENAKVSAGDTLFKLTDLGHTPEYESLLAQREDLTERLQALNALYQNNLIVAEFDGVVTSADGEELTASAADTSSASSGSASFGYFGMRAEGDGDASAVTLSVVETPPAETLPGETQPTETQPVETQPIETTPVETQPIETVPAETIPVETLPLETAPVTETPAVTTPDLSGLTGGIDYSGLMGGYSASSATAGITDSSAYLADGTTAGGTTTVSTAETTIITIAPNDHMTVDVSVDELDIGSIVLGQQADITIDALDGVFVGTVSQINTTGSSSGGVTKYTVTLSIDRTAEMLTGMNCSVNIAVAQADNCLTLPEEALNESATTTYVYTAYDEATGTLSGETEVTTGVSDGTRVEITSGLSQGDTVYYEYVQDTGDWMSMYGMPDRTQN